MNEPRRDVLMKALEAEVGDLSIDVSTLYTDDVVGWSPYAYVEGIEALAALAALRDIAFSDVVIVMRGLDEVGNKAFAEWLVEADSPGRMFSAKGPSWNRRDDESNWPASPSPTSVGTRSDRSGPISTTSH